MAAVYYEAEFLWKFTINMKRENAYNAKYNILWHSSGGWVGGGVFGRKDQMDRFCCIYIAVNTEQGWNHYCRKQCLSEDTMECAMLDSQYVTSKNTAKLSLFFHSQNR